MSNDEEIGRLHADLEKLTAEVAQLRERLDARDDALNRAISGVERQSWAPRLLEGGAHTVTLTALTVATGAATVEEALELDGDPPRRVQPHLLVKLKRINRGEVVAEFHAGLVPGLPDQHGARLEKVADRPAARGPLAHQEVHRGLGFQPGQFPFPGDPVVRGEPQGVAVDGFPDPAGPDLVLKSLAA